MKSTKPFLKYIQDYIPGTPYGNEGEVSVDNSFIYIYSEGQWRSAAISNLIGDLPPEIENTDKIGVKNGMTCYNREYFFIYYNGWKNVTFSSIDTRLISKPTYSVKSQINNLKIISGNITAGKKGIDGQISYDKQYFYVYSGGLWRKFAISPVFILPQTTSQFIPIIFNWENTSFLWNQYASGWGN